MLLYWKRFCFWISKGFINRYKPTLHNTAKRNLKFVLGLSIYDQINQLTLYRNPLKFEEKIVLYMLGEYKLDNLAANPIKLEGLT